LGPEKNWDAVASIYLPADEAARGKITCYLSKRPGVGQILVQNKSNEVPFPKFCALSLAAIKEKPNNWPLVFLEF